MLHKLISKCSHARTKHLNQGSGFTDATCYIPKKEREKKERKLIKKWRKNLQALKRDMYQGSYHKKTFLLLKH